MGLYLRSADTALWVGYRAVLNVVVRTIMQSGDKVFERRFSWLKSRQSAREFPPCHHLNDIESIVAVTAVKRENTLSYRFDFKQGCLCF